MAIPYTEFYSAKEIKSRDAKLHDDDDDDDDDDAIATRTNFMKPWGPNIWIVREDYDSTTSSRSRRSNPSNCSSSNSDDDDLYSSNDNDNDKKNPSASRIMVVCLLQEDGGGWIWNPVHYSKALAQEIKRSCGSIRHFCASHAGAFLHSSSSIRSINHTNTHVLAHWCHAYPSAKVHAPPGYAERTIAEDDTDGDANVVASVVVDFILTDDAHRDYCMDIDQIMFRTASSSSSSSSPHEDDVIFYHRLSETIMIGNLLYPRFKTMKNSSNWFLSISPSFTSTTVPSGAVALQIPLWKQLDYWWNGGVPQQSMKRSMDKIRASWKPKRLLLDCGYTHQDCNDHDDDDDASEGVSVMEMLDQALSIWHS